MSCNFPLLDQTVETVYRSVDISYQPNIDRSHGCLTGAHYLCHVSIHGEIRFINVKHVLQISLDGHCIGLSVVSVTISDYVDNSEPNDRIDISMTMKDGAQQQTCTIQKFENASSLTFYLRYDRQLLSTSLTLVRSLSSLANRPCPPRWPVKFIAGPCGKEADGPSAFPFLPLSPLSSSTSFLSSLVEMCYTYDNSGGDGRRKRFEFKYFANMLVTYIVITDNLF